MARRDSDEHYVLDLCDEVLGSISLRQHRFDFLLGDPSPKTGRQMKLPVDAYYPDLNLVIEYHERQHAEQVPLFDGRPTVSGVSRGTQRALYDQRRRELLPRHGINLSEICYLDLPHDGRKRLLREDGDKRIIGQFLAGYVDPPDWSHTRQLLHSARRARRQCLRPLW
jgi:hypothetical protein